MARARKRGNEITYQTTLHVYAHVCARSGGTGERIKRNYTYPFTYIYTYTCIHTRIFVSWCIVAVMIRRSFFFYVCDACDIIITRGETTRGTTDGCKSRERFGRRDDKNLHRFTTSGNHGARGVAKPRRAERVVTRPREGRKTRAVRNVRFLVYIVKSYFVVEKNSRSDESHGATADSALAHPRTLVRR